MATTAGGGTSIGCANFSGLRVANPAGQPDDLRRFIEHAYSDPLAAAWRLTACGLTRADVLGLPWSDVDTESGLVRISQGRVALDRSDHIDDPKSAARRRAIPFETVWPGTVALLRSFSARQAADRLRAGGAFVESGLVVVDSGASGIASAAQALGRAAAAE